MSTAKPPNMSSKLHREVVERDHDFLVGGIPFFSSQGSTKFCTFRVQKFVLKYKVLQKIFVFFTDTQNAVQSYQNPLICCSFVILMSLSQNPLDKQSKYYWILSFNLLWFSSILNPIQNFRACGAIPLLFSSITKDMLKNLYFFLSTKFWKNP